MWHWRQRSGQTDSRLLFHTPRRRVGAIARRQRHVQERRVLFVLGEVELNDALRGQLLQESNDLIARNRLRLAAGPRMELNELIDVRRPIGNRLPEEAARFVQDDDRIGRGVEEHELSVDPTAADFGKVNLNGQGTRRLTSDRIRSGPDCMEEPSHHPGDCSSNELGS